MNVHPRRLALACAVLAALVPAAAAAQSPDRAFRTPVIHEASTASISKSALRRGLARQMAKAPGASGIWVFDTKNAQVVYTKRGSTPRITASNMKLLTTAVSFVRFGDTGKLSTRIWRAGTVTGTTLHGNLYLVGGGDPSLAGASFGKRRTHGVYTALSTLASKVRAAGITKVTGRLYADDTIFDHRRGVPDSNWRTSSEIGPLSGLDYDSGFRSDGSSRFASDPAKVAAAKLIRALRKQGVAISSRYRLRSIRRASSNRGQLGVALSPTITRLIRETDVFSNNHWAEMLLKGLGARFRHHGTTTWGARVVRSFLRHEGIKATHQVDGSGLSRGNNASPSAIGRLLRKMQLRADGDKFQHALPLAGREGTLQFRMRGSAAEASCRAKTGTLHDVSALSGYCFNGNGRTMIFSILMNNVGNTDAARRIQDRMAALIARY